MTWMTPSEARIFSSTIAASPWLVLTRNPIALLVTWQYDDWYSSTLNYSKHHNFCNLQSTPPQQDPSAFQHSAWHSTDVLLMILSILERKNHLHKTPRILGNTDWQWRWQRQWSYVSATWPTRCLARTFLIAASSLSNKSKLPWSECTNSSV